jgi:hypothetical protein
MVPDDQSSSGNASTTSKNLPLVVGVAISGAIILLLVIGFVVFALRVRGQRVKSILASNQSFVASVPPEPTHSANPLYAWNSLFQFPTGKGPVKYDNPSDSVHYYEPVDGNSVLYHGLGIYGANHDFSSVYDNEESIMLGELSNERLRQGTARIREDKFSGFEGGNDADV